MERFIRAGFFAIVLVIAALVGTAWLMGNSGRVIEQRTRPVDLKTGNPDVPIVSYFIRERHGWQVTDPDGDKFFCTEMPEIVEDLSECFRLGGARR
jgi:hypothetical protein